MAHAKMEHINLTVSDANLMAQKLIQIFDWKIRWQGEGMDGEGFTIHVGGNDNYIALYQPNLVAHAPNSSYIRAGGLNHLAYVVDDLVAMRKKVKSAGYNPGEHHNYEPGERFYFDMEDGVEIELVKYD